MPKAYIIGAGPGSPDLITLRARRAVAQSDTLICDGLLPRNFLAELRINTENKIVIRRSECKDLKQQDAINDLMLQHLQQGRTVGRVKTGDPHIYGRGMEELEFLSRHGIQCEVIPGITAATAFSSSTDLPVTYRQRQDSFAVVTARCEGGRLNQNLPTADSLIVFMGVSVLEQVANHLLNNGRSPDTPAAIFERIAMPWEKHATGPLGEIADIAQWAGIHAPALFVVGPAVDISQIIPERPKILFTGLDPMNFRTLGRIIHWPAIQIAKNTAECRRMPHITAELDNQAYSHIIFTSRTSVRMFFGEIDRLGRDARVLGCGRVVACGAGTAGTLLEFGVHADLVPQAIGSEAILTSIQDETGGDVLIVQSATATEALANRLAEQLGAVSRLCLHRTEPHSDLGRPLPPHDVIYFTSPSGVRAYGDKYGAEAFENEAWCIGDVTRQELDKYGAKSKVVNPYVS